MSKQAWGDEKLHKSWSMQIPIILAEAISVIQATFITGDSFEMEPKS